MSVQNSANVTNFPFILDGNSKDKPLETIAQDAGRTVDLARYTLMSYNPTTTKWVPFTDETATDGTQIPSGIVLATVEYEAIVAGDVEDVPILIANAEFDQNQLVIENSKTLATIVNVPTSLNKSVEELLRWAGLIASDTIPIDEFENA